MSKYPGDIKLSAEYQNFINSDHPELWNKIIHLLLLMDMNGKKIFLQNKFLMNRFKATRPGIQNALKKLEDMDFITRTITRRNKRLIKINRGGIIPFLRCYNKEDKLYQEQANWSRERRFIRKKVISLVDFIKAPSRLKEEQFRNFVEYQIDYFNYDDEIIVEDLKDKLYSSDELDLILKQKTKSLEDRLTIQELYHRI